MVSEAKRRKMLDEEEEVISEQHEEEEEEDYCDDDSEESEDSESDDSIVVGEDEIEMEENVAIPEDEESPENAKKMADLLRAEAERFIKLPIDNINTRVLRDRSKIKKPDNSHIKLIHEAFIHDEKKELIKEINIWKRTFAVEAADKNLVFPKLSLKMSIDEIRCQHDDIREKLGLEPSDNDDDDSEEEEETDDDDSTESSIVSDDEDDEDEDDEDEDDEDESCMDVEN